MPAKKFPMAALLLSASLLTAQQVKPTSLAFEAVPPNTSPTESVAFTNTGVAPLTLSISLSNPAFAISENRCANGVKPGTHCNVYLSYTAQTIGEVDTGTVSFNYGQGVTSASLTGKGVEFIPTTSKLRPGPYQCTQVHLGNPITPYGKLWVSDKYYALPTGEPAHFSCTHNQEIADLGDVALQLCVGCPGRKHDIAQAYFVPDQQGYWTCTMTYDGDGILGPTSSQLVYLITKPGPPRVCCCGSAPTEKP